MSHINGGVAGIAKTRAIDTIESGPVLGIQASAYMVEAYGLKNLIAMDIGGTTISDDEVALARRTLEEMKAEAIKDMLGEGVRPDDATYAVKDGIYFDYQPNMLAFSR